MQEGNRCFFAGRLVASWTFRPIGPDGFAHGCQRVENRFPPVGRIVPLQASLSCKNNAEFQPTCQAVGLDLFVSHRSYRCVPVGRLVASWTFWSIGPARWCPSLLLSVERNKVLPLYLLTNFLYWTSVYAWRRTANPVIKKKLLCNSSRFGCLWNLWHWKIAVLGQVSCSFLQHSLICPQLMTLVDIYYSRQNTVSLCSHRL